MKTRAYVNQLMKCFVFNAFGVIWPTICFSVETPPNKMPLEDGAVAAVFIQISFFELLLFILQINSISFHQTPICSVF